MRAQELHFINTFSKNPFSACRQFVDNCFEYSIDCGKLLIKQYVFELSGEDIELQNELDQEKYLYASKIAYDYFKNDLKE